MVEKCVV